MAVNYLSYTLRVHDVLQRLEDILKTLGSDRRVEDWLGHVKDLNVKLESMRFQVAVVGEFKRGKTSFINALLRREILPADVAPATATINRVTYGDTPSSYIRWKDGRPDEKVAIQDLSRYITKLTDESADNAARIREAVVYFPCRFCENNVDLIDTPGMNDNENMNAVTIGELSDIDLAIVTLDPKYPISSTEADFIAKLVESDQICQIVFVASKMDTVPPSQRGKLLDTVSKRLTQLPRQSLLVHHQEGDEAVRKFDRLLSKPIIYPISAMKALTAYELGSQELLEESGFQRLTDELPPLIITTQHSAAVLTPLSSSASICREIIKLCAATASDHAHADRRAALRESFAGTAYGSWVDSATVIRRCREEIETRRRKRTQESFETIEKAYRSGGRSAAVSAAAAVLQRLATELPGEEESLYKLIWEQYFLKGHGVLAQALKKIIDESAGVLVGKPPQLDVLTCPYQRLPIRYGDQVLFGWSDTPVPPENALPGMVEYYITKDLHKAFDAYYDKRLERANSMTVSMTAYESEKCQQVVREYFRATPPVSSGIALEGVDAGSAGIISRAAEDLIRTCESVREQYLSELDGK